MTQVTRKRTQTEKFQEAARDFEKLSTPAKVFALLLFPGSFIILSVFALVAVLH